MKLWISVMGAAIFLSACSSTNQDNQNGDLSENRMLIIAADHLKPSAEEYRSYRKDSGCAMEITYTSGLLDMYPDKTLEESVYERVAEFAAAAPEDQELYVLLIGDAKAIDNQDPAFVPVATGRDEHKWWAYGDTPYADLDGDYIPDLHLGRLPFSQNSQVRMYLERLIEYEAGYMPGPWNKTISAFAGEGGFGETIDGLLEMVAGWVFDEMSYDFDLSMTYASATSEYYLPYDLWDADYARQYQNGAVMMPYIGHTLGQVPCCESQPPARRGLLAFFSCGDGSFQDGLDNAEYLCLAEEVLLRPHGPIASLGATTISHPYGNAIMPRELGHAVLDLREATYGRVLTIAKYNMVHRIDELRQTIDGAAGPFVDEPLDEIINSHLVMYNLLGDPLAPTHVPQAKVTFDNPEDIVAGQSVTLTGNAKRARAPSSLREGDIIVTLESKRSVILGEPPDEEQDDFYTKQHAASNNKVIASAGGTVSDTAFEVVLVVPPDLPAGTYFLKGHAFNQTMDAIGSVELELD
jgi:peptidase C25-like protein